MLASTRPSCAPSSTPTTPSPKKSATPPTARTSAIAWSPARARFSHSPTLASRITSRPWSSPTIPALRKSTTAPCTMPGPPRTNSSIAACFQKSPSISSRTPNPSASTNPAPSCTSFTNGPCALASTPRKKSTTPRWTNSPSSAKSTPNSPATSAPRATSAPASPPPSAPKAPTSAASKSGSTSPTSPAASSSKHPRKSDMRTNVEKFLASQQRYFTGSYDQFLAFGGPCVYFHNECLAAGKEEFLSQRHIEMLYATLTAWGMHRMGDSEKAKAKLTDWATFRSSVATQGERLQQFRPYQLLEMSEAEYSTAVLE